MRNTIIFLLLSLFAVSCGKDKYTTDPQLEFKSIKPNRVPSNLLSTSPNIPVMTLTVTDKEGDLGFKDKSDTSILYIRHVLRNHLDSFYLPDIQTVATSNFQGEIIINMFNVLRPSFRTNRPRVDTLIYEMYIVDFAKNKSNVVTSEPLYYEIQ